MIFLDSETPWKILESVSICLTFLLGIFSIRYVIKEYKRNNNQNERAIVIDEMNFYYKLKKEFRSERSVDFTTAILDGSIVYEEEQTEEGLVPFLRFDNNGQITDLKLDCLDNIEDIYLFYKRGAIKKDLIDEGFGSIISLCEECIPVQQFISQLRILRESQELYTGLHLLYEELS